MPSLDNVHSFDATQRDGGLNLPARLREELLGLTCFKHDKEQNEVAKFAF